MPCAEQVAFGKNGSDVVTAAVRLARAATGRDVIVQCGFHGFHDWYTCLYDNTVGTPRVLRPLIELLEADGHDVQITARPLSHTLELLDAWGHPYVAIGRYGGASKAGKARAAADRIARLGRFARGRGFDYALGHASADLPPVCRALRIPNTTMFDYEWATLQHHLICRLATRVLVPDAIPPEVPAKLARTEATNGAPRT